VAAQSEPRLSMVPNAERAAASKLPIALHHGHTASAKLGIFRSRCLITNAVDDSLPRRVMHRLRPLLRAENSRPDCHDTRLRWFL
jgi:hypothetical protein